MFSNVLFDVPHTIRKYADAVAYEKSIIPIRGDKDKLKPVAQRRKKHFNIRMVGNKCVVRLYRTDIVTYHPDDSIEIHFGGWTGSHITNTAIEAITGFHIYNYRNNVWARDVMAAHPDGGGKTTRGDFALDASATGSARFELWASGYCLVNPVSVLTHVLDIKRLNVLKKRYAAFLEYIPSAVKLCDGNLYITESETEKVAMGAAGAHAIVEGLHYHCDSVWTTKMPDARGKIPRLYKPEKEATFYEVIKYLAMQQCLSFGYGWRYHLQDPIGSKVLVKKAVEAIKIAYRHEVFKQVLDRSGVKTYDRNAKYFRE